MHTSRHADARAKPAHEESHKQLRQRARNLDTTADLNGHVAISLRSRRPRRNTYAASSNMTNTIPKAGEAPAPSA